MASNTFSFTPAHPFLSGLPPTCKAGQGDALNRCISAINMVSALLDTPRAFLDYPEARHGALWTLFGTV